MPLRWARGLYGPGLVHYVTITWQLRRPVLVLCAVPRAGFAHYLTITWRLRRPVLALCAGSLARFDHYLTITWLLRRPALFHRARGLVWCLTIT